MKQTERIQVKREMTERVREAVGEFAETFETVKGFAFEDKGVFMEITVVVKKDTFDKEAEMEEVAMIKAEREQREKEKAEKKAKREAKEQAKA